MIEIDMPVHPAASVFPMLSAEALVDLAADIKASGLRHPIVLDHDGRIVDGRNRYVACLMAGVEPTFVTLDGDPLAYIISANLNRRDLLPGQKVMAFADMLSLAPVQEYGRQAEKARAGGISEFALARAMTVREYPDLAEQVRGGASLKAAHVVAAERKRRREADEATAEQHLAYVSAEYERARERLEAARAAIGPTVSIPPEPELDVVLTPSPDGAVAPDPAPKLADNLDRESAFLARLAAGKHLVADLADEEPIGDAWYFEGHVMAVRSWASQVVAMVYGMVDRYNAALDGDGRIRRVK